MKHLLRELGVVAIALFAFSFGDQAYAQACPGGFYPDGTCIGPCQNCLNTGNCTAAFAGWQCDPNATCSVPQYVLCYPTYNTYDVKYGGQFCGLVIDWQDGECIPGAPWLPFNQLPPRKERSHAQDLLGRIRARNRNRNS